MDEMDKAYREDSTTEGLARDASRALEDLLNCSRVKGTMLGQRIAYTKGEIDELRAHIVRVWD